MIYYKCKTLQVKIQHIWFAGHYIQVMKKYYSENFLKSKKFTSISF